MNSRRSPGDRYFQSLRNEHRYGLLFCWRIKEGIRLNAESRRITRYLETFWIQNLSLHFKEEEMLFFMDKSSLEVQKAMDDHVCLCNQVQKIISIENTATPHQLTELANLLDSHIRFEEKIVFPHLMNAFTQMQFKDIESVLSQPTASIQLKNLYPDEFWRDPRSSL